MAIGIALIGFNGLGRSVTPTFLFRNRFYLQLSPHCPKMNKKSTWAVKLKISKFLSTGHGIQRSGTLMHWFVVVVLPILEDLFSGHLVSLKTDFSVIF